MDSKLGGCRNIRIHRKRDITIRLKRDVYPFNEISAVEIEFSHSSEKHFSHLFFDLHLFDV